MTTKSLILTHQNKEFKAEFALYSPHSREVRIYFPLSREGDSSSVSVRADITSWGDLKVKVSQWGTSYTIEETYELVEATLLAAEVAKKFQSQMTPIAQRAKATHKARIQRELDKARRIEESAPTADQIKEVTRWIYRLVGSRVWHRDYGLGTVKERNFLNEIQVRFDEHIYREGEAPHTFTSVKELTWLK